jgi:peptidoglycan-associated lipoprotein
MALAVLVITMTTNLRLLSVALLSLGSLGSLVSVAACHHDQAHTTLVTPDTTPPATQAQPQQSQPVSTNVSAGDDLVAACKLHFDNTSEAPKFDFDQFELTTQDRDVLSQIATCVTNGPLKGKKLALVGRADPRGTSEYNLGLGDRRANTVAGYLERLGLRNTQVASKTRGALDATGNDESSWRIDRRVDVELATN